jgi:hypothetical protein
MEMYPVMKSPNVSLFKAKDNVTIRHAKYFRKAYFYSQIMKYL